MKLNKQLFKSICMLTITGIMFLGTAFLYLSITFGWLAGKHEVEGGGMQVIAESDKYEIYIDKTTVYDNENIYEGITNFKGELTTLGKRFNETDPVSLYTDAGLALELVNESRYENTYFLVPGSHGYFILYIKPKAEGNFIVELDISLSGYKKGYRTETVNGNSVTTPYVYIPDETDESYAKALKMLKGHILFFGGRNATTVNGEVNIISFSDFLENHISYNTQGKSKVTKYGEQYYELKVYWEWPLLYSDMIEDLQNTDANYTHKYPSTLETYINAHKDYFFANNETSTDEAELSDAYNDGDQLIGDNIHFLVVTLK